MLVFFSSKDSNASEWTKGEILAAKKYGKPILPVRLDESEYAEATEIILPPLQYIRCRDCVQSSFDDVSKAVATFIGGATESGATEVTPPPLHRKTALIVSAVVSVLLSLVMMFCTTEHRHNLSLSLFIITISPIFCFAASGAIVMYDKKWADRAFPVNIAYILSVIFFLSYSITAFGLCYANLKFLLMNYPSILCAAMSLFALNRLMCFKKYGYILLWVCALSFSFGSYWWVDHTLTAPLIVTPCACLCMAILTRILRIPFPGKSLWQRLE